VNKAERKQKLKEAYDRLDGNESQDAIACRKILIELLAGHGLFIIERSAKVDKPSP